MLSYIELCDLVESGVIKNVKPDAINGTSIDLHLGYEILIEKKEVSVVDLSLKPRQSVGREEVNIYDSYYDLQPYQGILAHTVEVFDLPPWISAEYYLNSSLARNHLEHLHAGHCDPWWSDSTLTLELVNLNRYHILRLRPGMRIGQVVFFKVTDVPREKGYLVKGNYNNQTSPQKTSG